MPERMSDKAVDETRAKIFSEVSNIDYSFESQASKDRRRLVPALHRLIQKCAQYFPEPDHIASNRGQVSSPRWLWTHHTRSDGYVVRDFLQEIECKRGELCFASKGRYSIKVD